jgi:hypothetical protein
MAKCGFYFKGISKNYPYLTKFTTFRIDSSLVEHFDMGISPASYNSSEMPFSVSGQSLSFNV